MSNKSMSETLQSALIVFLLVVTTPVHAEVWSSQNAANNICTVATPMELNSSLRAYTSKGAPSLVELVVPSGGILSVSAAARSSAGLAPEVVVSLACLPRSVSEPLVLERSANHLVLAVGVAGPYVFRVDSQDPSRFLGELKVSSAFVADATFSDRACGFNKDGEDEEEIEIDGFASPGDPCFNKDGEDEEEIEIDGFVGQFVPGVPDDGEDEEEIEIDGFVGQFVPGVPDDGEDEEEIEIDGFAAPLGSRSLISKLDQLCRQGEVDDHGDFLTCATFLNPGRAISGEIGNGWGDDTDTFHFILGGSPDADLWTVVIEAVGDVDTVGGLYNQMGQRLDAPDDSKGGNKLRIVRSLHPGAYFVRIEGRYGDEGAYTLRINASP